MINKTLNQSKTGEIQSCFFFKRENLNLSTIFYIGQLFSTIFIGLSARSLEQYDSVEGILLNGWCSWKISGEGFTRKEGPKSPGSGIINRIFWVSKERTLSKLLAVLLWSKFIFFRELLLIWGGKFDPVVFGLLVEVAIFVEFFEVLIAFMKY